MKPAGYANLIRQHNLAALPNWHESAITAGAASRVEGADGRVHELFPAAYEPGPSLDFSEVDAGEDQPMFESRKTGQKRTIVFNRQHPVLKFVADEARQRPALVLDVLAVALSEVADEMPGAKKFIDALETQLRETLKKK